MKNTYILLLGILAGCNVNDPQNKTEQKQDNVVILDTGALAKEKVEPAEKVKSDGILQGKTYSNERFKDVTVEKIGDHEFRIKGKGQIFEASFSWVVEDGHDELKKGFEMTDAGAPEWGDFSFTVNAPKKRPNSTLHIILFEASAKDGSRQYLLPIALY